MVLLEASDKDLCRFFWRRDSSEPLQDYRILQVTFGVAASSYTAKMAMRQISEDFVHEFPGDAKAVKDSFYADDVLLSADFVKAAISFQHELQQMFARLLCVNGIAATLRYWSRSQKNLESRRHYVCSQMMVAT